MTRRRIAPLLAGFMLTGCSLLSIKSPEIPLTAREQEARLLTRDYAAHFAATITHLIDEAQYADADSAIKAQALRLKLRSTAPVSTTHPIEPRSGISTRSWSESPSLPTPALNWRTRRSPNCATAFVRHPTDSTFLGCR
jgi:hypothetical protein